MIKSTYVGKIVNGTEVMIGSNSPNQHIIITGISGAGKSVRISDIERHIMRAGGTVVAFDVNGTHLDIEPEFCNSISAQEDGLEFEFLDTSLVEEGKETMTNLVEYIMETICPRELRGACQLAAVRKAIAFAIENRKGFSCEMEAIAYGLSKQKGPGAMGAYNHLHPILEGNIFRKSEKEIQENKVNVISLKGINPKTQKRIIEIILNVLWRKIRIQGEGSERYTLMIDEFQNLDLRKDNVLFRMLTEARKYGLRLILATQTLSVFDKKELAIINQAAIKLFFQPSVTDMKAVAEFIEPGQRDKWVPYLHNLQIGQAITVGELEINSRPVGRPIVTSSDYVDDEVENR